MRMNFTLSREVVLDQRYMGIFLLRSGEIAIWARAADPADRPGRRPDWADRPRRVVVLARHPGTEVQSDEPLPGDQADVSRPSR